MNPALSGHTGCGLYIGGNYRSQGKSVSTPYVSQSVFVDGRIQPWFTGNGWFGLGATVVNDKAGDGALRTTGGIVHLAWSGAFGESGNFVTSIGFSGGYFTRNIDQDKLVFGSQWTGQGFDPTISSGEPLLSVDPYLDLGAGMLIRYRYSNDFDFHLGTSLYHINNPDISFYEDNTWQLDWKWVIHGSGRGAINEEMEIEPGFMFVSQSSQEELFVGYQELILGANVLYDFYDATLYGGLWARFSGDIIPLVGIEYSGWQLLMSYDVNVSGLHKASKSMGGFEFSLSKKLFCSEKERRPKYDPCRNLEYR